jgi:ssRNA-specific RNase YbeY (16S rRNA maturation enzyme)
MINIISSSRYKIHKDHILNHATTVLDQFGVEEKDVVNIVFVGKRKMTEISNEYKHENVALPVLAFPYKQDETTPNLFGEVILCYPQVVLLAAERQRKLDDIINQLVEHGLRNLLK